MSLLAGPRNKNKYGIDPRNTNWSNDESKYGQKLMEKMGWSKGKGLGANEDGMREHIKATYKWDKGGVGARGIDTDAWTAHLDDFNDLLKQLNSASDEKNAGEDTEAKAKDGQKRYYGRFARGRVQMLRSTEDLDCIFGRRKAGSGQSTPQTKSAANSDSDSDNDDNSNMSKDVEGKEEKSHGLTTITSSSSVQDYFAKKMAEMKMRKNLNVNDKTTDSAEIPVQEKHKDRQASAYSAVGFSYNSLETGNAEYNCDMPTSEAAKAPSHGWQINTSRYESQAITVPDDKDSKNKKKKKEKKSKDEMTAVVEPEAEITKKGKKSRKRRAESSGVEQDEKDGESHPELGSTAKKIKKHEAKETLSTVELETMTDKVKVKKRKKNKKGEKRRTSELTSEVNEAHANVEKREEKKKKKTKNDKPELKEEMEESDIKDTDLTQSSKKQTSASVKEESADESQVHHYELRNKHCDADQTEGIMPKRKEKWRNQAKKLEHGHVSELREVPNIEQKIDSDEKVGKKKKKTKRDKNNMNEVIGEDLSAQSAKSFCKSKPKEEIRQPELRVKSEKKSKRRMKQALEEENIHVYELRDRLEVCENSTGKGANKKKGKRKSRKLEEVDVSTGDDSSMSEVNGADNDRGVAEVCVFHSNPKSNAEGNISTGNGEAGSDKDKKEEHPTLEERNYKTARRERKYELPKKKKLKKRKKGKLEESERERKEISREGQKQEKEMKRPKFPELFPGSNLSSFSGYANPLLMSFTSMKTLKADINKKLKRQERKRKTKCSKKKLNLNSTH